MNLSEQEICRIAASIRLTGELLEANGSRALTATSSWQPGPRSPNLDPNSGGWRYDININPDGTTDITAIPNDTTGEAAIHPDPHIHTSLKLAYLIALSDQINTQLRGVIYTACPQATGVINLDPDTPAQISAAGWCVSCHRDSGYCEPVSMRPDGTRRYRDYCTWCGEFIATQERTTTRRRKKKNTPTPMPPLELIQARHRGQRITQRMVDDALNRNRTQQKKAS